MRASRLWRVCAQCSVTSLPSHTAAHRTAAVALCARATALHTALSTARRLFTPLPSNQEDFTPYVEIDLPSETRIEMIRRAGLAEQEWVACEKVHGTNFAVYLLDERELRFAKRSGIMDPNENFFGYHVLADEFAAHVRIICELLKQKFGIARMGKVVLHGELFGAKYDHPLVPRSTRWCTLPNGKRFPIAGVEIQREPFPQYSPELHFFAFDIKYSVSGGDEDAVLLDFDTFSEVCARVPGLLYAKALVRGSLDACLAFDVENFHTPLPALLGLGNYPLEHNLAEGVVIRHVKRGSREVERLTVATIIKLRCSSFMELKHPGKQQELKETFVDTVRAGALRRVKGNVTVIAESMLPQVEAAANGLLLNHVSEGRLSNVVSKVGVEPLRSGQVTRRDLALLLAKDALKDFLKEGDELVLNTSLTFRKMLIRSVYWAADELVRDCWDKFVRSSGSIEDSSEVNSSSSSSNEDTSASEGISEDNAEATTTTTPAAHVTSAA